MAKWFTKENSMKISTRSWTLSALVALGASLAQAQAKTNVAMVVQCTLTGVKQEGSDRSVSVRISNKDILSALNDTGRFDFSSNAQLIFLSFEGELPSIAVRQRNGTDVVTTDVSSYFFLSEPLEIHTGNHMTSYAIYVYNFNNRTGTRFTASGMTTLHAGTITGPGIAPLTRDRILSSSVTGPGTLDGANMVVRGTVKGGSAKAEID
jgi:hypothetical protein